MINLSTDGTCHDIDSQTTIKCFKLKLVDIIQLFDDLVETRKLQIS